MGRVVGGVSCGLVVAACLLASCRKSYTVDVAAVNDLVPEKYKYKLQFEARELTSGLHRHVTYTLPVPKSWRTDEVGGANPVDTIVDGQSSIWMHSSCDAGDCSPKNWSEVIDSELQLFNVERDDRGDEHRVVVYRSLLPKQEWLGIRVYRWSKGAAEYHVCEAILDPPVQEAAPAFEKACELAVVHDK